MPLYERVGFVVGSDSVRSATILVTKDHLVRGVYIYARYGLSHSCDKPFQLHVFPPKRKGIIFAFDEIPPAKLVQVPLNGVGVMVNDLLHIDLTTGQCGHGAPVEVFLDIQERTE